MKLAELTWAEAREKKAKLVILPVGSCEQHGHHLPLNNDTYVAEGLAHLLATELTKRGCPTLVAPALPIGLSPHHMGFYGSLTLSHATFTAIIKEVCSGLAQHGLSKIVIVNGHGGNSAAIRNAVACLAADTQVAVLEYWRHLTPDSLEEIESGYFCHACEGETSLSMALGQRTCMGKAVCEYPANDRSNFNLLNRETKPDFQLPPIHTISSSGVLGDATLADKGKGERILAKVLPELLKLC